MRPIVPDRKGEIADQPRGAVLAPAVVRAENEFAIPHLVMGCAHDPWPYRRALDGRVLRQAILETFDVTPEVCQRDLRALLLDLAANNLIEIRDATRAA